MPADWESLVSHHREAWLQRFAKAFENERSTQITQTPLANKDEPNQGDDVGNSVTPRSPLSPQSPLFVGVDTRTSSPTLHSPSTIESPKGQNFVGASTYCNHPAAVATVSDISSSSVSGGESQRQGEKDLAVDTRKRSRAESPRKSESQQSSTAASPRSVSSTEAQISLARLHVHKKSRLSAVATSSTPAGIPDTSGRQSPPEWYKSINLDRAKPKRGDREIVARLRNIGTLIDQAKVEAATKTHVHPSLFDEIRNELHFLEFIDVSEYSVRKAQLLDNNKCLPQLFEYTWS
jgi:hypothetical protein